MKILDEIKTIVEDTLKLRFLYSSINNINAAIDNTELPCVAVQKLITGTFENEGGQIKDSAPFLIMFLNSTIFDYDSLENQTIIDALKVTVKSFIREVDKSDVIIKTGSQTYDDLYDYLDANVTGIALSITLKERAGTVPCLVTTVVEEEEE